MGILPGGDPLTWSNAELNYAVQAKKADREYLANMALYIVYHLGTLIGNKQININDIHPDIFIQYIENLQPQAPTKAKTPEDLKREKAAAERANNLLYQRFIKRTRKNDNGSQPPN